MTHISTDPSEQGKSLSSEITALLHNWGEGDAFALNQVISLVYNDLRRTARYYLQRNAVNETLQPTALVHEVYERLIGSQTLLFNDRVHFFRCARMIMRQIMVKHARLRGTIKRGGEHERIAPEAGMDALGGDQVDPDTLLAVDDALVKLVEMDPRKHQIVELRFFVGLTIEEMAEVMEISERTVRREWQSARSWLARELKKK